MCLKEIHLKKGFSVPEVTYHHQLNPYSVDF